MQTAIPADTLATDRGQRADAILRTCVHCGMCNATCPTFGVRGDELDGPRGRIYLIKGMLETGEANAVARTHLDRCLTCRGCETTCPSGVRYGELAEIGREILEEQRPNRGWLQRLILNIVPNPRMLKPLVALGSLVRGLLPRRYRRLLRTAPQIGSLPDKGRILLWQGCVQRVVTPEVNAHLARLLEARGMAPFVSPGERCCGGLALHLGRTATAEAVMRHNVAEVLADFDFGKRAVGGREMQRVAWHPPCTLQHGQRLTGLVERILEAAGYELTPVADAHLCCGSAGSYSLLQPDLAGELKRRKALELTRHEPEVIATANIGCQTHLDDAVDVPVVHWLELLE